MLLNNVSIFCRIIRQYDGPTIVGSVICFTEEYNVSIFSAAQVPCVVLFKSCV